MPSPPDPRSRPPRLDGVEVVGEYQGSGSDQATYLLRRADGRMLEVSPLVYAVAINIDGDRDLDGVAVAATSHVGRRVSAENVAYLVEHKLRPLGILAGDGSDHSKSRAQPVLGLGLRRTLLGPRAVDRAARFLGPLFRTPVLLTVLAAVAVVDGHLLVTADVVQLVKRVIYQPLLLLVVWGLMALGGMFHELGHATATRYGGATPGRIGVGIYLLWPAFYNDLTDSYRLSRSARLRADLGGIYFNAVFILAVAGVYGVTRYEPLLAVIALQHVAMGQQLLPFVRLDGYYVLSDLIGVPDLFGRVRPVFRGMLPTRRRGQDATPLRPRARVAVTTWVLLTVPALAASVVLLVVRLPSVLELARDSAALHATALQASVTAQEHWLALLSAIQLTVLTVPFVGAALVVVRLLRKLLFRWTSRRKGSEPSPPPSGLTQARMDRVMSFSCPRRGDVGPGSSLGFGAHCDLLRPS